MNRKEELRYLTMLCWEASRRYYSNPTVSPLELEVQRRLDSLLEQTRVIETKPSTCNLSIATMI